MLPGLIVLLVCQLVGEFLVRALDVPLPGPILGMMIMLVVLRVRRPSRDSGLVTAPETLLHHLPLLYVPAGVGVIAYLARLRDDALPVAGGLLVSWFAGLVVTAAVTALLLRVVGAGRTVR
jgi:holin-like protein